MNLRDYQKSAADAAIDWVKKCTDPCLIYAPTGSGKSWIAAAIAHELKKISGKKVLVLAPNGELVQQNYEKYLVTGEPASIFSASRGMKDLRHDVVFGSPLTVANSINKFGSQFGVVILDEAHLVTQTVKDIVAKLTEINPKLRLIGMTATPYRLKEGRIYNYDQDGALVNENIDSYFHSLVCSIDPYTLIERGFLCPPITEYIEEHYNTSGLVLNSRGQWDSKTVDAAFVGHGRKTSMIVADVVEKSRNRQGVLFFAATIKHAEEIFESLPKDISRIITGATPKKEREEILNEFKKKKIKYLVNVAVLTTGFDAPHVDVIAVLRATESAALYQQIIGRGLRPLEGKDNCLILDYAENIKRHFPDGNIFEPEIKNKTKSDGVEIQCECPTCNNKNIFKARPNKERYGIDDNGYFVDLAGNRIGDPPIPAHYGRRCQSFSIISGKAYPCTYKWSFKVCEKCTYENDIAARYCSNCKSEIVDPNEKLRIENARIEKELDKFGVKFANVTNWQWSRHYGRGKPDTLRVKFFIEESPNELSKWFSHDHMMAFVKKAGIEVSCIEDALVKFSNAKKPSIISYQLNRATKYYDVKQIEFPA